MNRTPQRLIRGVARRIRGATTPSTAAPARPDVDSHWFAPVGPSTDESPHARIVLLNDCRDQVNFGANALVDGLLRILGHHVPSATIHPIPSHWLIDVQHLDAFHRAGEGMTQPRVRWPKVADQFDAIADDWLAGRGGRDTDLWLDRFRDCDLVVFNGEGSLYRNNPSAIRGLFLAWLCRTRLGLPTVHLNGGLHLTDVVPLLNPMVRKTFGVLDAVTMREAPSFRNLQTHVPDVRGELVPDAAFALTSDDALDNASVRAIRERFGGRPYLCFDPGAMPMDDRADPASTLHRLVEGLRQVVPEIVLVSSAPADEYIGEIARATGAHYVEAMTDYREFMALAERAALVVSGRYHNVILAAIMGCPSIAFGSTTHKVHGACEMLEGICGSPHDGTDLLPRLEEVVAQAKRCVAEREALRTELQAICERRRGEAGRLGEIAASVLAASRP